MKTLADIKKGETAIIKKIICTGSGKQRLLDLGLVSGAEIKHKIAAPLGDPVIYEIKNFELGLRRTDAKNIIIEMQQ